MFGGVDCVTPNERLANNRMKASFIATSTSSTSNHNKEGFRLFAFLHQPYLYYNNIDVHNYTFRPSLQDSHQFNCVSRFAFLDSPR